MPFVFLVPPDIINEESSADLAVQESEDATLTCRATGNPTPRVTWRREDGDMIYIRKPGNRELTKGGLNVLCFLYIILLKIGFSSQWSPIMGHLYISHDWRENRWEPICV